MINTIFILLNSAKILAKVVVSIYISTSSMAVSVVQISCNRRLKFFVNVMDVKWFFIVLIYIFIFIGVEYLFIFFLLCTSIFIYFASFSIEFCFFFLLHCGNSLYHYFWSDMCVTNIFSQTDTCLINFFSAFVFKKFSF